MSNGCVASAVPNKGSVGARGPEEAGQRGGERLGLGGVHERAPSGQGACRLCGRQLGPAQQLQRRHLGGGGQAAQLGHRQHDEVRLARAELVQQRRQLRLKRGAVCALPQRRLCGQLRRQKVQGRGCCYGSARLGGRLGRFGTGRRHPRQSSSITLGPVPRGGWRRFDLACTASVIHGRHDERVRPERGQQAGQVRVRWRRRRARRHRRARDRRRQRIRQRFQQPSANPTLQQRAPTPPFKPPSVGYMRILAWAPPVQVHGRERAVAGGPQDGGGAAGAAAGRR